VQGALPKVTTWATPNAYQSPDDPSSTVDLGGGWTCILAKYDQDKAGSWVWLINDLPPGVASVNFPATLPFTYKYGLSHYPLFIPANVPDGGSALSLFGLAMLGSGYLRYRPQS
jgi:hypothetical protein